MVTTKTNAVINFNYFCFNYPSDFIMKVWSNDMLLQKHLTSKFVKCHDSSGARGAMLKFFTELDQDNQRMLVDWVNENYLGFSDLHKSDEVENLQEEKKNFSNKVTAKWKERRKYIGYEWGTKAYREIEMEFFQGAMAATGYEIPYWGICMMSGREIIEKD